MRFIVLLGLVSLCADVTYEGARSITGPFLAVLSASGAVVGVVAGLGELLGYSLRLLSGLLSGPRPPILAVHPDGLRGEPFGDPADGTGGPLGGARRADAR